MAKSVEFYFDYGSPNAYLAYVRLPAIAKRHGAEVVYRIMLLGGVFKATSNHSPMEIVAKRAYGADELRRFSNRYGVPFKPNPYFPINTLQLMRGAVAAEQDGCFIPYSDAIFRAMWVDGKNLGEPGEVRQTVGAAGIDPDRFGHRIAEEAVKEKLKALTLAAAERGVFGAPTFFVGNEMFFGQDRLDFVEDALQGRSYL